MGIFDKLFGEKKEQKNLTKKCPYCGQSLHIAAFKCTRCNKWVNNELFNTLCDDDVKLIKNKDITPCTPSLIAMIIFDFLKKDNSLEEDIQRVEKKTLSGEQQFNLLVFKSFCYFNSIGLIAHKKRRSRDAIMDALRNALLQRISELYLKKLEVLLTEKEMKETVEEYKERGKTLYRKFEAILDELGTNASSQLRATNAFGSIVLGEDSPISFTGLAFYTYLMETFQPGGAFSKIFLVEEEDFDWRTIVGI